MITAGKQHDKQRNSYNDVAVILPAYNEEITVGKTVEAFREALPGCIVVVCNNASTDATSEVARKSGALVIDEPKPGKGNAVRRLLTTVDADFYLMADADSTYDANAAPEIIHMMEQKHLDMVTGVRSHNQNSAYRSGHVLGNKLFNYLFCKLFKTHSSDIFSGYRGFTKRFAYAMPVQSSGFEIETEMTALASILRISVGEITIKYSPRPSGSISKLNTYFDGLKILSNYFRILRHFYPKRFYGALALIMGAISISLGIPIILEFIDTGLVPRMPTAVLASSLGIISTTSLMTGLILESIARNRIEQRQLIFFSAKISN